MTRFALLGVGWRARFFARVAEALPDQFELVGVVARNAQRAAEIADAWACPVYPGVSDLFEAGRPDFVVLSVPWAATVAYLEALAEAEMPVLCETPPAPDLAGLRKVTAMSSAGARVQVAEQYQYQPMHAARLSLTDSGAIGRVSMASLSFAHGYHCFSLMRRHLGISGEPATLRVATVRSAVESGPTKDGPREERGTTEETRTVALLDFGDRLGVYDFADTQYFSYVRGPRVHLRGAEGEITEDELHLVRNINEPTTTLLRREVAGQDGDLGGHYLEGISGSDGWVWRNPFPGARLYDDEIAVATCLEHMGAYAVGGAPFYGVADAAQDHYLYLCLREAAEAGGPVTTEIQPWSEQVQRPASSR